MADSMVSSQLLNDKLFESQTDNMSVKMSDRETKYGKNLSYHINK